MSIVRVYRRSNDVITCLSHLMRRQIVQTYVAEKTFGIAIAYQHTHRHIRLHKQDSPHPTQSLDQNALACSVLSISQPTYIPTSALQPLYIEPILQTDRQTM